MYFKTAIVSAIALLFASQAMGDAPIAYNPYAACNCPDNCFHRPGSICEYYADDSHHLVYHGRCHKRHHHVLTVCNSNGYLGSPLALLEQTKEAVVIENMPRQYSAFLVKELKP
ncbi:hypothetical protein F4813DRAFT_385791 [Daldinia decipiens]|uniref:uncharacterized protein n=1 Tax=Daldinia decipiens TaxID=326647 RepID=UPI0020C2C1EA|nr:uncharacterized protein F4813DRAFT_385791 [Daldinia decipiens]KAI1661257.1 hypothetical protein F4813DRAFT_385791 [Daldinia decipiens]